MRKYKSFLLSKRRVSQNEGVKAEEGAIHPKLFDFQRSVTVWALRKGRAALFLDTGLGKTFCQLEWARLLDKHTLILAPLSVARQTIKEGKKIGVDVKYIRGVSEIEKGHKIYISNYEMLDKVSAYEWGAVVLDESSILKSLASKTRTKLIDSFQDTPFRLACTATPAPNDQTELGNHAEFLGICKRTEMLAEFFIHANKVKYKYMPNGDSLRIKQSNKKGQEWRIKYHAKSSFYRWLSSWAISMKYPSDLGFKKDGFNLPSLEINPIYVRFDKTKPANGRLFFTGLKGISDRVRIRKATTKKRVSVASDICENSNEQWIVWCGLQQEADRITEQIQDAKQVKGSDKAEYKQQSLEDFQDNEFRVLVTKPRIAGFGMNFQNAHNMIFLGLGDSWEQYYQCIRRQWRFGQKKSVKVLIVLSDVESEIYRNVLNKERTTNIMHKEMIKMVSEYEKKELSGKTGKKINHNIATENGNGWTAMLGDACERLKDIENESIDLTVFSPPFADLYTYSQSERDLGNCKDWDEFFNHYKYIVKELLRVVKTGRLCCVHTADIPALMVKDGYIGMRDFPGAAIKAHEDMGWLFWGRAVVTKNPQAQAIRTHSKGLLFAQLKKNSAESRPAILDQVLIFKKKGKTKTPIEPLKNKEMDNETWIKWASGVWTGVSESDTLRYARAREPDDEKHICPLQLGTIERCLKLYSNPGEMILTPFGGIGSEAYQAIKFHRKATLIELKKSYYKIAIQNLKKAEKYNVGLFE